MTARARAGAMSSARNASPTTTAAPPPPGPPSARIVHRVAPGDVAGRRTGAPARRLRVRDDPGAASGRDEVRLGGRAVGRVAGEARDLLRIHMIGVAPDSGGLI